MAIIGLVVVLLIIGVGAYYYLSKVGYSSGSNTTQYTTAQYTTQATTAQSTSTVQQTAGSSTVNTTTVAGTYTVMTESNATYGNYLANGTGYTLYFYTQDKQGSGTSACNGGCASAWPPFYVSNLVLGPGLNASDFSTITRSDGTMQLAYQGRPLYLFRSDTRPGQITGNGVNGFIVAGAPKP